MAEPARSAAGPGPDQDPDRRPDPRAAGWGDVRAAVILETQATRLAAEDVRHAVQDAVRAIEELRHPPHDPGKLDAILKKLGAALEMNRLNLGVMQSLTAIAGRCQGDDKELDIEYARGYAQGAADCKAARCRLEVVDGGRDG